MVSVDELRAQQQLLLERSQQLAKTGIDPATGQSVRGPGGGRVLGNIQANIAKEYERLNREIQQQNIVNKRQEILAQGGGAAELQTAGVTEQQQSQFFAGRRQQSLGEIQVRGIVQPRSGSSDKTAREQLEEQQKLPSPIPKPKQPLGGQVPPLAPRSLASQILKPTTQQKTTQRFTELPSEKKAREAQEREQRGTASGLSGSLITPEQQTVRDTGTGKFARKAEVALAGERKQQTKQAKFEIEQVIGKGGTTKQFIKYTQQLKKEERRRTQPYYRARAGIVESALPGSVEQPEEYFDRLTKKEQTPQDFSIGFGQKIKTQPGKKIEPLAELGRTFQQVAEDTETGIQRVKEFERDSYLKQIAGGPTIASLRIIQFGAGTTALGIKGTVLVGESVKRVRLGLSSKSTPQQRRKAAKELQTYAQGGEAVLKGLKEQFITLPEGNPIEFGKYYTSQQGIPRLFDSTKESKQFAFYVPQFKAEKAVTAFAIGAAVAGYKEFKERPVSFVTEQATYLLGPKLLKTGIELLELGTISPLTKGAQFAKTEAKYLEIKTYFERKYGVTSPQVRAIEKEYNRFFNDLSRRSAATKPFSLKSLSTIQKLNLPEKAVKELNELSAEYRVRAIGSVTIPGQTSAKQPFRIVGGDLDAQATFPKSPRGSKNITGKQFALDAKKILESYGVKDVNLRYDTATKPKPGLMQGETKQILEIKLPGEKSYSEFFNIGETTRYFKMESLRGIRKRFETSLFDFLPEPRTFPSRGRILQGNVADQARKAFQLSYLKGSPSQVAKRVELFEQYGTKILKGDTEALSAFKSAEKAQGLGKGASRLIDVKGYYKGTQKFFKGGKFVGKKVPLKDIFKARLEESQSYQFLQSATGGAVGRRLLGRKGGLNLFVVSSSREDTDLLNRFGGGLIVPDNLPDIPTKSILDSLPKRGSVSKKDLRGRLNVGSSAQTSQKSRVASSVVFESATAFESKRLRNLGLGAFGFRVQEQTKVAVYEYPVPEKIKSYYGVPISSKKYDIPVYTPPRYAPPSKPPRYPPAKPPKYPPAKPPTKYPPIISPPRYPPVIPPPTYPPFYPPPKTPPRYPPVYPPTKPPRPPPPTDIFRLRLKGGEKVKIVEFGSRRPNKYAPSLTGIARMLRIKKTPKDTESFAGTEVRRVPIFKQKLGLAEKIFFKKRRRN